MPRHTNKVQTTQKRQQGAATKSALSGKAGGAAKAAKAEPVKKATAKTSAGRKSAKSR